MEALMPIGAILGLAGSVIQGVSANSAANQQQNAANAVRQQNLARMEPWYQAGQNALAGYSHELMGGKAPEGWKGFTGSPGYKQAMNAGRNAVQGSAYARGGLNSGATLKALQRTGMATQNEFYDNWLTRIGGMVDMGANAAAGQNITNANGQAAAANAGAAGTIGIGNAINGGIQNYLGAQQYMGGLQGGGTGSLGLPNPFG
jgi:hypothetical protein